MKYLSYIIFIIFSSVLIISISGCAVIESSDTIEIIESNNISSDKNIDKTTNENMVTTEDDKIKKEETGTENLIETRESSNRIMFVNHDVNFAFVYPQDMVMLTSNPHQTLSSGDIYLCIDISNIEDLNDEDRKIALEEQQVLSEGNFGPEDDFVFEPSKNVFKAGETNVKEFIIFNRYDNCDVVFDRNAVFYNNGYRVSIKASTCGDEIIDTMDSFFIVDEKNCGEQKIWNIDRQDEFYSILKEGKASLPAIRWYSAFDTVMELLQINEFKGASGGYSRVIDKRLYEEDEEKRYIITAAYPEFQSAVAGDLDGTINDAVINKTVLPIVDDFIKEVESYGQEEHFNPNINYFLAIDYNIALYSDRAISLNFDIYPYLGGAHGMTYFETFNYNIQDGSMISLVDLFKPGSDYLSFISSYCQRDISDQINSLSFEVDEEWLAGGTDPSNADNFKYFLITADELIIKFLPYQVAPYALGDFTVKIPYEEIEGLRQAGIF